MKISDHISYREAIKSNTAIRYGILNLPDKDHIEAMKLLAEKIFEPVRKVNNKPIAVTSFFRNERLNSIIGGSSSSQHMSGEAMDIDADIYSNGITNGWIFHYIRKNLDFDQLIAEFPDKYGRPRWIHVSYSKRGNRNMALVAKKKKFGNKIKTVYEIYDPKKHLIK